jgi:hypothetical protein
MIRGLVSITRSAARLRWRCPAATSLT